MAPPRKSKFLWSINDRKSLQLWPKCDEERYLTKPFLPARCVNTGRYPRITAPKPGAPDWLAMRGIDYAAFSRHSRHYFCERVKKGFPTVIYTISGGASVKNCGKNLEAKKGSVMILTSNSDYVVRVKKTWNILWFHIKRGLWEPALSGGEIIIKPEKNIGDILRAAKMFADEAYSAEPDAELSEGLAMAISAMLRRSVGACAAPCARMAQSAAAREKMRGAAAAAARKMGITKYELDKQSRAAFGQTFAKKVFAEKMGIARKLLLSKKIKIQAVALKCGYKNAQSFSKAFSRFHKTPPGAYKAAAAKARQ